MELGLGHGDPLLLLGIPALSRWCPALCLQEAAKHLTFAPHLIKAAAGLLEAQLGREVEIPAGGEVFQAPYVAIQWRSEYAGLVQPSDEETPAGMLRCAYGMVDFVTRQIKVLDKPHDITVCHASERLPVQNSPPPRTPSVSSQCWSHLCLALRDPVNLL